MSRLGKAPTRRYQKPAPRVRTLDRGVGATERQRGAVWAQKRERAWLAAKGRCYVCGTMTELHGNEFGFDLDHITPLAQGGSHEMDNLGVICKPCHIIKTREENQMSP